MFKPLQLAGVCVFLGAISFSQALAVELPSSYESTSHYEIGFEGGVAAPIGNRSISIEASNAAFLVSDPGSPGEDEFAENGLPSPDFTAKTTIVSKVEPQAYLGGHVFYHVAPFLAPGILGSVTIRRSLAINNSQVGGFGSRIYDTEYKEHGAQIAGVLRLGDWVGRVRLYALGGFGPYFLDQAVTAELLDADDPDHPPVTAASQTRTYLSAIWGGGIDYKLFDEGSIGFSLKYQRVFCPQNNLQFVIPTLHLDGYF